MPKQEVNLYIEIESEDQSKYSNSFIIIAASHRPRYIWRDLQKKAFKEEEPLT